MVWAGNFSPTALSQGTKRWTSAVTLSADLINQTEFMRHKYSDLKRLRCVQGVFKDFLMVKVQNFHHPPKLEVERHATSALTFTFHTWIISDDKFMRKETEILRSTLERVRRRKIFLFQDNSEEGKSVQRSEATLIQSQGSNTYFMMQLIKICSPIYLEGAICPKLDPIM